MKKLNEQKFWEAYEVALKAKEAAVAEKEAALAQERADVEALPEKYETIKETLLKEVLAKKEAEFDFAELDAEIAKFEQFLDEVEEVVANEAPVEEVEGEAVVAAEEVQPVEAAPAEQVFDQFGNPIQ